MAIKQGQIRYVTDDYSNNYPANLTAAHLISGAMFDDSMRIQSLNISSNLFGLKFYVNNTPSALSTRDSDNSSSGMTAGTPLKDWTLNLQVKDMPVYSLRFDAESIQRLVSLNSQEIAENQFAHPYYLFINYTYIV